MHPLRKLLNLMQRTGWSQGKEYNSAIFDFSNLLLYMMLKLDMASIEY